MKNNDIQYVKKIIEYCDIADNLLDEYERDYLLFQTSQSFQLSTSMCIVQIGEYVSRLYIVDYNRISKFRFVNS